MFEEGRQGSSSLVTLRPVVWLVSEFPVGGADEARMLGFMSTPEADTTQFTGVFVDLRKP